MLFISLIAIFQRFISDIFLITIMLGISMSRILFLYFNDSQLFLVVRRLIDEKYPSNS